VSSSSSTSTPQPSSDYVTHIPSVGFATTRSNGMASKEIQASSAFCVKRYHPIPHRVARIFSVQHTKTGKNIPNDHQMGIKHSIWQYIKSTKCPHKYQHLPIQNRPKIYRYCFFLVWKHTIWQHWYLP
jgi:hypothetical protein